MTNEKTANLQLEYMAFISKSHLMYSNILAGFKLLNDKLDLYVNRFISESAKIDGEPLHRDYVLKTSINHATLAQVNLNPTHTAPTITIEEMRNSLDEETLYELRSEIVISTYTFWEEYVRIEIAKTIGIIGENETYTEENKNKIKEKITDDFWGDMRHLRTSFIHNNSMPTEEALKKMKTFKLSLSPKQKIKLRHEDIEFAFQEMRKFNDKIPTYLDP